MIYMQPITTMSGLEGIDFSSAASAIGMVGVGAAGFLGVALTQQVDFEENRFAAILVIMHPCADDEGQRVGDRAGCLLGCTHISRGHAAGGREQTDRNVCWHD